MCIYSTSMHESGEKLALKKLEASVMMMSVRLKESWRAEIFRIFLSYEIFFYGMIMAFQDINGTFQIQYGVLQVHTMALLLVFFIVVY